MAEWVKVLVGALAGMVTGIFGGLVLEPAKDSVMRRIKAHRIRNILYRELSIIYLKIYRARYGFVEPISRPQFETSDFDYYHDNQREICHAIDEWITMKFVYRDIKATNDAFSAMSYPLDPQKTEELLSELKESFDKWSGGEFQLKGTRIRKLVR